MSEEEKQVKNENESALARPSERRLLIVQILAALGTSLQLLAPGMTIGFSAITVSQLRESDPYFEPLNKEEISWFASIATAATTAGCIIAAFTLESLGRRRSFMLLALPGLVGWGMLAFTRTHVQLYAGRILSGLALGIASSPVVVYMGEIITPKLRGALLCWNSISIALGVSLSFALGTIMTWRHVSLFGVGITLIALIAAFMLPESPMWLIACKNRADLAEKSLKKLRGGKMAKVEEELESIIRLKQLSTVNRKQENGLRKFFRSIKEPEFWKPLLILHVFFAFSQVAGIYVVMYYAVDILVAAGATDDIKYIATVMIGVIRLVVTIALSAAMTKFGRRSVALLSGIGMTTCMVILTSIVWYGTDKLGPWPGCLCILLYFCTSTIGFLTLPWAMLGEMFPSDLRGVGSGITTCMNNLFGFIVLKVFPGVMEYLGAFWTFAMFGMFAFGATVFVFIWLPETAGKTLEEIQAGFISKEKRKTLKLDEEESVNLKENPTT